MKLSFGSDDNQQHTLLSIGSLMQNPLFLAPTLSIINPCWSQVWIPQPLKFSKVPQKKIKAHVSLTVLYAPSPYQRALPLSIHSQLSNAKWTTKWALKFKSHTDDNKSVLRHIFVEINMLFHCIRHKWSMTHFLEWIQVIKLELLPSNGSTPLGTKRTH